MIQPAHYTAMKNTTCRKLSSPKTLEAARRMRDNLLNVQVAGCPLRFWPVVIAAETDGLFYVVETGFATAHEFPIVK